MVNGGSVWFNLFSLFSGLFLVVLFGSLWVLAVLDGSFGFLVVLGDSRWFLLIFRGSWRLTKSHKEL